MKFMVKRTSNCFCDNVSPCETAKQEPCIIVDERNVDDPIKNKYIAEDWYLRGENHRVENGHIKRDLKDIQFFIEIESLDELVSFVNKNGSIVIEQSDDPSFLRIEIYDDYRE